MVVDDRIRIVPVGLLVDCVACHTSVHAGLFIVDPLSVVLNEVAVLKVDEIDDIDPAYVEP